MDIQRATQRAVVRIFELFEALSHCKGTITARHNGAIISTDM